MINKITEPDKNKHASMFSGIFPHQLSWLIDNPVRRLLISPKLLVERLSLSDSYRILEIGPGSGYFSTELATKIPNGRLELFDMQPQMLDKAKRKLQFKGLKNIGYTVGNASEFIPFPDGHFDIAFLACVFGEIKDQIHCLKSLHRVLNPTGVLCFYESIPDPDMIRFEDLQRLLESQGFKVKNRWVSSWKYTVTFEKSDTRETKSSI